MIQFNLLPDIKLEYIKSQRIKRMVISIAIVVTLACVAIVSILAINVYGVQKSHIDNLSQDISDGEAEIQSIDQFDRILTVQNQLVSIPDLHGQKPVTSRLFSMIESITPSDVRINRFEVDFESSSAKLSGQADDLASVNKFVDTIKFTNYILESEDENLTSRAFSNVVLTNFSRTPSEAAYTIDFSFEPIIFDVNQDIELKLEEQITTRSEVERPQPLFSEPVFNEEDVNNGQN